MNYSITFIREIPYDLPLYSVNKKGKAYISGWIKTTKNKMYKKTFYGIKDINAFLKKRRIARPDARIIDWQPIKSI